ncbi:YheC/YheD family protein [Rossellomorea vietnamensis]|uniref:YheC/YheD family protein n=1 Tax=Rossellomorea vietnamensis TaxID=218284 RepID=A0A5D4MD56_9BACI|nr:YheC/YheD family protein [Rossellomorea vietnamensis]TYR99546.1 YheC/YheD family protein [Rossellomorea vietnamensis]
MFITCSTSNLITGQPVLSIPENNFKEWRAFADQEILLVIGHSRYMAKVAQEVSRHDNYELLFPENHSFRLRSSHNFSAKFSQKQRTLFLGPVIAVLTDEDSSGRPSIGQLGTYYDELHRFTKLQGGYFFLTGTSLLNQQKGLVWDEENGEWLEGGVPLPDIVYNRIHSRKSDRCEPVRQLINRLEEQGAFVFNSSYLTKDAVNELLSGEDSILDYLPHTETFTTSSLRRMLGKHNDLFIKHIAGSQGKKLLRLSYLENDYRLIQNIGGETLQKSFSSFEETVEELSELKVSSHFIIQETIELLSSGDRALDFRFLCHLIAPGEWKLVSSVARISGDGQFVSNIAQGGDLAKPLKVLSTIFSRGEANRIYKLMEELALAVCSRLAEKSSLTLGELGIDLGVDKAGKPWIIEVNSKPSKQTYFDTSTIRPSVKTLYHLSKCIWEERRALYDKTGNFDAGA